MLSVCYVIPTLGQHHRYLVEAVDSCLADADRDATGVTVLVVVDGTVELGAEVARRFEDFRVRVLTTGGRRGAAAAINLGVASTTADVIARLDDDDLTLPGRTLSQLTHLETHPHTVAVATEGLLIDAAGDVVGQYPRTPPCGVPRRLLVKNPVIHSSLMVRRSTLVSCGGYDERLIRMQDYALLLRLAEVGGIDCLPETLTAYRVHPHQSSRRPVHVATTLRAVLAGRRRLARELGASRLRQHGLDTAYVLSVLLRYVGLRRPGYVRAAAGGPPRTVRA